MAVSPRSAALAVTSGLVLVAVLATSVAAEDQAVSIVGRAYDPAELTVAQGDAVIWSNTDAEAHTVTADDGAFDSDRLAPEEAFGNLFETAGTFAYHCTVHPEMTGVVVVTEVAATPTEPGSIPPAGTLPPGFGSPSPTPGEGGADSGPLGGLGSVLLGIAVLVVAIAVGVQLVARRQRAR